MHKSRSFAKRVAIAAAVIVAVLSVAVCFWWSAWIEFVPVVLEYQGGDPILVDRPDLTSAESIVLFHQKASMRGVATRMNDGKFYVRRYTAFDRVTIANITMDALGLD